MPGLLLAGVALCTALIMLAALVVVRNWRRRHGQSPTPASVRGAAAGPGGSAMAQHAIAIVPGFSDAVPRARVPQVPVPAPVRPRQAARPQARSAADPRPEPHGPGPSANGQRASTRAVPTRAVTTSEQIASYYDQADKPMADYLTAMGWAKQPPHSTQPPDPAERTQRRPPPSSGHRQ